MATPEGHQGPDRLGQEHPEDHARDGDGRRRAPAPGRAADRGTAALRATRSGAMTRRVVRGGREHPVDCRSSRSTSEVKTRRPPARHRRPRPRRRVQLADHPRRQPPRAPSCEDEGKEVVWFASGRRGVSSLNFRGFDVGGRVHGLHRPPRVRRRPRRSPTSLDHRLRRRRGRPRRDHLQPLHLAADAGGAARDAAAAAAGRVLGEDEARGRRRRRGSEGARPGARGSTSPTPRRSSRGWCPTTSRSRSTGRCSSRPRPSTARA